MNHNQASILEPEEVAQVLKTNLIDGLTSFEARERSKRYGLNRLNDDLNTKKVHRILFENLLKYSKQFLNPLIQLLILCIIISLAIGEFENAISVSISVLIVCTISFIQEHRADKSLEKLNKQMPNICEAIREGQVHEMESQFLVPGDIIYLNEGQRVPADVRLFDLHSMSVNESNLTGETQSQLKITKAINKKKLASFLSGELSINNTSIYASSKTTIKGSSEGIDNGNGDTTTATSDPLVDDKNFINQNLALMGTMIEAGHSRGIVISTGKSTRYGEVYCLLKSTVQPQSPLQNNIDQLSIHLVVISCSIIAIISIIGIIQKRSLLEVAYYSISLAVTAIPEGLPVVVAVIMALGVLRLSKQKTIVKSLNSIETLGCIQVLCSDKTGTLTRNDMTLTDIVTSELHSISSEELEELNNDECKKQMTFNKFGGKMFSIGRLMEAGTLCNNSSLDPNKPESSPSRYIGQATECALLEASIRLGFGDSRTKFERLREIPFTSSSRRMAVLCERRDLPGQPGPMYYVKGAWEEILKDCTHYYECGLLKPKSDEIWCEYVRICTTLGSQGLRVLALATGPSMEQLTFVGIVGISNTLRDGIANAIYKLKREFFIDVKMITGDSRDTAVAIGRTLGLIEGFVETEINELIMSGDELQSLLFAEDEEKRRGKEDEDYCFAEEQSIKVAKIITSKNIFYRVDPIQKAKIVSCLQELDKIVAMTGDGINDVISLKKANLSLVMGSGADVCKEIADVIIVDNNLSVLIEAIVEGKGIYHKIRSFMSYQISISLSLVFLVALSFASKVSTPFTVIQLLFINILTDGPPAQSLGVEKVNEKDLSLKPRNVHEPIISFHLARTLSLLTLALFSLNGSLFYSLLEDGELDPQARAMLFTCFVLCTVFAAISLRSKTKTIFEINCFGNKELLYCCFAVIAIQICILNLEFLNKIFEVEPLSCLEFILIFTYASLILVIMDLSKVLLRLWKYLEKHIRKKNLANI